MMLPVTIYIVILIHPTTHLMTVKLQGADLVLNRRLWNTFVRSLHCLWNETKMQSHDTFHPTAWTFEKNDYTSRNSSLIVTCVVASKKQYLLKWNHSTQYLLLSNNTHPTHSIQMKSIKCAPPTSSASRLDS